MRSLYLLHILFWVYPLFAVDWMFNAQSLNVSIFWAATLAGWAIYVAWLLLKYLVIRPITRAVLRVAAEERRS